MNCCGKLELGYQPKLGALGKLNLVDPLKLALGWYQRKLGTLDNYNLVDPLKCCKLNFVDPLNLHSVSTETQRT